jgi:hypothetical protein
VSAVSPADRVRARSTDLICLAELRTPARRP